MARKRRRKVSRQSATRRYSPPRPKSLGHTVDDSDLFSALSAFPDSPVRYPLIRTVPVERAFVPSYTPRLRAVGVSSPAVAVRATGRSSDRAYRNPMLQATGITPELTERAIVCARRTIRREVLFASKRTGKGSHSPKRYTLNSKKRC